jgi:hypothetical protein
LIFVIFEVTWLTSAYRTYFRWKIEEGKLQLHDSIEDRAIGAFIGSDISVTENGVQSKGFQHGSNWFVQNRRFVSEWVIVLIIIGHVLLFMGATFLSVGK